MGARVALPFFNREKYFAKGDALGIGGVRTDVSSPEIGGLLFDLFDC